MIFAIDPGPVESAFVEYEPKTRQIVRKGKIPNETLRQIMRGIQIESGDAVVIERLACYGMPVGHEVFETAYFIGELKEMTFGRGSAWLIPRAEVKSHLCNSAKAKDANVRHVVIDRFGGKAALAKGKKCKPCNGGGTLPTRNGRVDCGKCRGTGWAVVPGMLAGVKADVWQALALAITFAETRVK